MRSSASQQLWVDGFDVVLSVLDKEVREKFASLAAEPWPQPPVSLDLAMFSCANPVDTIGLGAFRAAAVHVLLVLQLERCVARGVPSGHTRLHTT